MANPPCESNDGNTATFVATMLQTGHGFALCDECLVPWAAALLQAMTGVDPAPFIEAVSEPPQPGEADPEAVRRAIEADEADVSLEAEPARPGVPMDTESTSTPVEDPPPPPVRRGRTSQGSADPGTGNGRPDDGGTGPMSDASPAA